MQVDLLSSLVHECLDRHAPLIRTKVSRCWHHHWLTFWITVLLNRYFHRRRKSPESAPYRRSMRSKPTMISALFQFCLYCLKWMNVSCWNKWPTFHPMRLVVFSRTQAAPILKDITQLYRYDRHAWWHPERHETWWSYYGCPCWLFKGSWHNCLCNHIEKNSPARFFHIIPELDNQLPHRTKTNRCSNRRPCVASILRTVLSKMYVNVSDHLGNVSSYQYADDTIPFTRTTSLQILRYATRLCS